MQEVGSARARCRHDVIKVSGTSPAQRRAWQEAAKRADTSLSRWMREAADAAVVSGLTAADLRAELVQLRAALTREVGNNLTQIAAAVNQDLRARRTPSVAPHEVTLVRAAGELAVMRRKVEALLRRVERSGAGRRR